MWKIIDCRGSWRSHGKFSVCARRSLAINCLATFLHQLLAQSFGRRPAGCVGVLACVDDWWRKLAIIHFILLCHGVQMDFYQPNYVEANLLRIFHCRTRDPSAGPRVKSSYSIVTNGRYIYASENERPIIIFATLAHERPFSHKN